MQRISNKAIKIVVAPDSFKGSLTSVQVADGIERGIKKFAHNSLIERFAIADGGEGSLEAIVNSLGGEFVPVMVHDPLMREMVARYGVVENSSTAVIEIAAASGLPLLNKGERNPTKTTTFGSGELILDALKRGCRSFIICIGGSATNDAGIGMLSALGYRFLDINGDELQSIGEDLVSVSKIDSYNTVEELKGAKFTVACDVTNPLYGKEGAAYVFAPQKGATPKMVEMLDAGLKNFSSVVKEELNVDISRVEGAGAAGGLGGAFIAFLGAELKPGIELILDTVGFNNALEGADLVITGEGKLDRQTTMGKAPMGVLKRAKEFGVPVIAIGGAVEDKQLLLDMGFTGVYAIKPKDMPLERAMEFDVASENLERCVEGVLREISQVR